MPAKSPTQIRLRIDDGAIERLAVPVGHPDDGREFHRRLTDRAGEWRVDAIASLIPWRSDMRPMTDDERHLSTRLAVLSAWDAARRVEGLRRGRREAVLNVRNGDYLLGGQHLPDVLDQEGETPSPMIGFIADLVAKRLGIELKGDADDGDRLRAAAMGRRHQGRAPEVELPYFIRSLALWWWRYTRRRPERRINDARKSEQRGTFVDFAVAAGVDCSRSGRAEPEGIRSTIRQEIAAMEKSRSAPWISREI